MASDELHRFRTDGSEDDADESGVGGFSQSLLLFEYSDQLLGVSAEVVDAVIAWRQPARMPGSPPSLAGVVQDRGRIVAVLRSPLGDGASVDCQRILVVSTAYGYIGLPAQETREVRTVELADEPVSGGLIDSSEGPLTYLDPEAIAAELRGKRRPGATSADAADDD